MCFKQYVCAKLIAGIVVGFAMNAHAADPSALPQKQRSRIEVVRQKLDAPSPLMRGTYVDSEKPEMIADGGYSADNGRTWQPYEPQLNFTTDSASGYRRLGVTPYLDPASDRLIQLFIAMDIVVDPAVDEPMEGEHSYYLRYRVSTDGGRTWLFDEPIIQAGDTFDAKHPIDGVWIGKNAMYLGDAGSRPITLNDGTILVPTQVGVLGDNGELALPGGGFTYTDVVVLRGTWQADNRLQWDVSQRVQADPKRSTRGMLEPTLAKMPDGRILMVMRGSNGGTLDPDFKIPGYRWYSISDDGGATWTEPKPWRYSDGSMFFSPSSMSQLLQHSSGRYFWIGNICPSNSKGNNPRDPLVIGEVDPASMMLIRRSVTVIDRTQPEDTEGVELSTHATVIEDRETGELIIPMLRHTLQYKRSDPYFYRINVGTPR